MKDEYFLLYSDGTWSSTDDIDAIKNMIENHWWAFPLDIKGDARRVVRVLSNVGIEEIRKGV